jgi:hypothetical protein
MDDQSQAQQRIAVYTGPGSSNSWVWLAEFLERNWFLNTKFAPDPQKMKDADIIVIPGGDTLGIAGAFGEEGLRRISRTIERGMGYVGICAGAYLPLRSSIPPLSAFNLLDSRIANISSSLPDGIADRERYSVRYGCAYVFHPARGPMALTGDENLTAPLYGGPSMIPSPEERVLLSFKGLTEETEVLVNREVCLRTTMGKAACIEGHYGKGRVVCSAVHLEHPDYPEANNYFARTLSSFPAGGGCGVAHCDDGADIDDAKRTMADLRVLANALDPRSWKVGVKYWESDKFLFYIDAIRRRIGRKEERVAMPLEVLAHLQNARRDLKALQEDGDEKTLGSAIDNLSKGASLFMTAHFARLHEQLS